MEAGAALAAYKNGAGGILGGTGIGDFLFLGAAPAIVALGFSLYEQRVLLRKNLLPIIGGSTVSYVLSYMFFLTSSPMCMCLHLLSCVCVCVF
jgi:putative effector of murein hydrolase